MAHELLSPSDIAADLGTSERYVRQQVRALGVPHLDLGRGRMKLNREQYDLLLAALTAAPAQRTGRSRPRAAPPDAAA